MRQAGCLIPLFSIRSPSGWGLGEIPDLAPFARWAASAGFSVVQILPVNEVDHGQASPYSALSAFALDPVYLAIEALEDFHEAGGMGAMSPEAREEIAALRSVPAVAWQRIRGLKAQALSLAFESFIDKQWNVRGPRAGQLERYAEEHRGWLDEYALFAALHGGPCSGRSWIDWEAPLRDRDPAALASARAHHSKAILFNIWLQWQLDEQWHAARRACNSRGVELMGDLPFVVATDSADVWSRSSDFRLDARAGVPPDAFSATGQDWGLPVYRWDVMEEGGYQWVTERARRSADLYDLFRVDHVVGLFRTFFRPNDGGEAAFIPKEEPDQIKNGEQVMAIYSQGARVVAEDLGTVPDFVRASLTRNGMPGYRVLRWEREWNEKGKPFRDPADWPVLSVGTTGTHDTETVAEWYESIDDDERGAFLKMPGMERLLERAPTQFDMEVRDAVLEAVYGSGSDLMLLPFQDLLGARERINVPGTVNDGNWSYRMPMQIAELAGDIAMTERLRSLARRSGRTVILDVAERLLVRARRGPRPHEPGCRPASPDKAKLEAEPQPS